MGKKDAELIKKELGPVRRARRGAGAPEAAGRRAGGADRDLRPVRLQQVALGGVLGAVLPDGVAQGALSRPSSWRRCSRSEIGNTDKVVQYINEARELGLEVLPPDVNESGFKFTVVGGQADPLRARRRPQRGRRAPSSRSSRAGATGRYDDAGRLRGAHRPPALQQAGGRVAHRGRRLRLAGRPPQAAARGAGRRAAARRSSSRQEREAGQASLFGEAARRRSTGRPQPARRAAAGPRAERLAREKEVIGFFISGHPLERYRAEVELFGTRTTATLHEWSEHPVSDRRGGHGAQAADLARRRARSTRGWCWRTSTAPRRRSSSPTPGPSSTSRSCPTRRCCSPAATAPATGARTGRRSSSSRRGRWRRSSRPAPWR